MAVSFGLYSLERIASSAHKKKAISIAILKKKFFPVINGKNKLWATISTTKGVAKSAVSAIFLNALSKFIMNDLKFKHKFPFGSSKRFQPNSKTDLRILVKYLSRHDNMSIDKGGLQSYP